MEARVNQCLNSAIEWANSLIRLPQEIIIGEIIGRIRGDPIHNRNRECAAQHEAGHAIALLFANQPIHCFSIGRLRRETYECIEKILPGLSLKCNYVGIESIHEQNPFKASDPEEFAKMMLAGLAATKTEYSDLFEQHGHLDKLQDFDISDPWTDLSEPCKFVANQYRDYERSPSKTEVMIIVRSVIDKLNECFQMPKFKQAMQVLRTYMVSRGKEKGPNINKVLLGQLKTSGITDDDFEECRKIWKSIAFDIQPK